MQAPLVELVEDDHADALERWIAMQHARQHAFRDDFDRGTRPDTSLAARAEAHRITH